MRPSRSLRRKTLALAVAAGAMALLYQATVIDSRTAVGAGHQPDSAPTRVEFIATAYCKGETTASGVAVRPGMAAADPKVLPLGSWSRSTACQKPTRASTRSSTRAPR